MVSNFQQIGFALVYSIQHLTQKSPLSCPLKTFLLYLCLRTELTIDLTIAVTFITIIITTSDVPRKFTWGGASGKE